MTFYPKCLTFALTIRAQFQYLSVNIGPTHRVDFLLRITRVALTFRAIFRSHHLGYASRLRPLGTDRCPTALRTTWRHESRPEEWMAKAQASPKKYRAKVPGQAGKKTLRARVPGQAGKKTLRARVPGQAGKIRRAKVPGQAGNVWLRC